MAVDVMSSAASSGTAALAKYCRTKLSCHRTAAEAVVYRLGVTDDVFTEATPNRTTAARLHGSANRSGRCEPQWRIRFAERDRFAERPDQVFPKLPTSVRSWAAKPTQFVLGHRRRLGFAAQPTVCSVLSASRAMRMSHRQSEVRFR